MLNKYSKINPDDRLSGMVEVNDVKSPGTGLMNEYCFRVKPCEFLCLVCLRFSDVVISAFNNVVIFLRKEYVFACCISVTQGESCRCLHEQTRTYWLWFWDVCS